MNVNGGKVSQVMKGAGTSHGSSAIKGGAVQSKCRYLYTGTIDAARKIVRMEGMQVLWRGTPAALAMAIPQVGIYMPTYEALKHKLTMLEQGGEEGSSSSSSASVLPTLVAGTTARSIAVLITSPLERARTRAQAFTGVSTGSGSGSHRLRYGMLHEFGSAAGGGFSGLSHLWRGTMATLARDVPFSGIYWVVTEKLRTQLTERRGGAGGEEQGLRDVAYVNLLAGTAGGVVAASVTTPLDVVKTRIQVDLQSAEPAGSQGNNPRVSGLRQVCVDELDGRA